VLGAPGLPEPRQEGTGLGHQACSGRIVLDDAQHADRDRPTCACWGVAGTGPEAGSTAVVTPPWTSRRHGGAPETHAVARWAAAAGRPRHRHPCRHRTHTLRRTQGPSTHLTSACPHLSRCGDHDPMRDPARMSALPDVVCHAFVAMPRPAQGVHVFLWCAGLHCPPRLPAPEAPAPEAPAPRHVPLSAAPAGRRLHLRARQQCSLPVRTVCPSYGGPLAAALALPSRPLRRRGLVHRLHHPVAWEHSSTAWHACSLAPGKPMTGERRAPFRP
jgi:hypothetical protein